MNEQYSGYSQLGMMEDGSLEQLMSRLKPGMILRARIILRLEKHKYLLRIYGCNLVMESHLEFNRFDEIDILVSETSPRLIVQVVEKSRRFCNSMNQHGNMDLLI